jgi:peptidyl-prolyl cis-trans isomerase C
MITFRMPGIAALLMLAVTVGCGKSARETREPAAVRGEIVRVGEAVLTGEDIAQLAGDPDGTPLTLEERQAFIQRWVDTQVLYQEAVRRGLRQDPEVKSRLSALEQQYLADYLVFTELRDRTQVSEAEIGAYFAAHEREYLNEYRVSQIIVGTAEDAARAQELLATRSFEWVANRHSIDAGARRGGDLGYLTKGNMIPELEAVIFSMQPGEVSGVIKSDFGYHIFKLVDVREALVTIGLEDVRDQIMNTLMLEKRTRAYRELLDSLRAGAVVVYRDEAYERGRPLEIDTSGFDETGDTTGTP